MRARLVERLGEPRTAVAAAAAAGQTAERAAELASARACEGVEGRACIRCEALQASRGKTSASGAEQGRQAAPSAARGE